MRMLARLRHFIRARSGLAALEFALIAPMMILLLFGSVELIDAVDASRRAQNATSSLSDVVARDTAVSDAEVAGLWSALDILMFPDNGSGMAVRITSIRIVSSTEARVEWSEVRNSGFSALAKNTAVSLPSPMMVPGSSIIRTETIFSYHPPLNFLFAATVPITHTSYRRSRLVDPIPRVVTE
jgi:Flp pilus assembly protein TadG